MATSTTAIKPTTAAPGGAPAAGRPAEAATARSLAVTVLAGGPSGERAVSLQSGTCVADALTRAGHRVYRSDIGPEDLAALSRPADVVFVALHGRFGEDGAVQRILEQRGIPYVGSGPEACALAMNKPAAKRAFVLAGLPTPRFDVARRENLPAAAAAWSLPVVVKPTCEGSSLNCHIVREPAALPLRAAEVIEHYGECLIEEYVPGLEVTVGVVGDRAMPPIEIRTNREFYDYRAKYEDDDTVYRFSIDLPEDKIDELERMSLAAHRCLGCRDFSRVDWRVDPLQMRAYILEVNVIPGMTSHSLLPKAAAQVGMPMPALCDSLVRAAWRRAHP